MIFHLITILIVAVIGAVCFWALGKFVRDDRLVLSLRMLTVVLGVVVILRLFA